MSLIEISLLLLSGLAAGSINALAGGGTIFTFSALLGIGIPPVTANATSAVSVLPGQTASAFAYRKEIRKNLVRLLPMVIVSAIGGVAGGFLLLNSGDDAFRALVPYLILAATILFILAPWIAKLGDKLAASASAKGGRPIAPVGLQGLVAVYGGYFGAGMGIMMLASLSLTEGRDFHAVNAAKNLLATVMQGLAVVVFLFSGVVNYEAASIVAVASIVGGWGSVYVARIIPSSYIRVFVILTGLSLSLWYFVN